MKLIYTPEGQTRREWDVRPREWTYPQAIAIESLGWETFGEFGQAFQTGNRRAVLAALWHFLSLEDPKLKFEDLQPKISELDVDLGADEIAAWRQAVQSNPDLTDERRAELLAEIDEQAAEVNVDLPPDVPEGKDQTGEEGTSSP